MRAFSENWFVSFVTCVLAHILNSLVFAGFALAMFLGHQAYEAKQPPVVPHHTLH